MRVGGKGTLVEAAVTKNDDRSRDEGVEGLQKAVKRWRREPGTEQPLPDQGWERRGYRGQCPWGPRAHLSKDGGEGCPGRA